MKILFISLRFLLLMILITGILYPAAMTSISQLFFHDKANGSLITDKNNTVIGSDLIAQKFEGEKYFWPRPSAVDYNPMPSGGSNLGPTSQDLVKKVIERKEKGFTHEMLFASGSGLDPHISPDAAKNQIARIASARGKSIGEIETLLNEYTESRQLGLLGEPRVNVLRLNLAMDKTL